ncbi:hypothetical protein DS745_05040 [Anaerobacillus alkaliphilus]|uniref:SLH domain-containing protein n=1 Tax=Anaerobacillus alkaliphilus TaxID=1548597 RepID=A0A4Q0VVK8_9BACI|nr:hypothetical protein DS745_05040 [Anaerobacillus alkaliphilus]
MAIIGLCTMLTFSSMATVGATTILGEKRSEAGFHVSPGVFYTNQKFSTETSNQNVNVLDVNINDPFTRLNLNVTSPITRLSTTGVQALLNNRVDHQVVGAVNASFNETGTGFSLPANLIALNNQILHFGILSPDANGPNFQRNAFGIAKDGKPLIDNYEPNLRMIHNGNSLRIHSINTQRFSNELVLFTPTNRTKTVGQQTSQWSTEIVVTNASKNMNQLSFGDRVTGTVSQVARLGEHVNSEIPANGFVLSGNGGALAGSLANVKVGDQISIDIGIDPKWQDARYMIGTGPILVRDGKVNINMSLTSSFARDPHPRTAVAYSKDRDKVFLVTIDGRQSGFSNGVSLQRLAEYLISLGADYAINLDGGGSTTMVVRNPGYGFPALVNSPSDGNQRGVSSTLQVVDTRAPKKVTEQAIIVDPMTRAADWKIETARATASIAMNTGSAPARNGEPAVRLNYDLTGPSGTAAAYLVRNRPILFDDRPLQVGAWVFGDGRGHWLRGTIFDGQGKQHNIDFTTQAGVTWTGWRYVRANVPNDLPLPISLERMYVVQTADQKKSKGTLYIDQIQAIYQSNYQVDRFTDMKTGHWALSAISMLNDRNVITGMFDGSFRPNQSITREQAAIMLVRELGIKLDNRPDPGFADVTKSTPNYNVIAAVADEGLFTGKTGNRFEPRETLTRAEMAVILQRAYKLNGVSDVTFKDVASKHWANGAIQALAANDVTKGFPDGTFKPSSDTTRAEFSVFLSRLIK